MSNSEPRFAREFYMSWPWIKCQRAYKDSKGRLCERCLKKGLIVPGREVHHKIRLTPERKPQMDAKKCVGCHLCVLVCPQRAITPSGRRVARKG